MRRNGDKFTLGKLKHKYLAKLLSDIEISDFGLLALEVRLWFIKRSAPGPKLTDFFGVSKGGKLLSLIVPTSEELETDKFGCKCTASEREITCGSAIMIK